MKAKIIDSHFTAFWGVFLNLSCNLNCPYCIQKISLPAKPIAEYKARTGAQWVEALNAIANRTKKRFLRYPKVKKLSILGGEPTIYPDFLYVINNLDKNWKLTITSNLDSAFFDNIDNLKQIKNKRRVRFNGSLHFLYTPAEKFINNLRRLKKAGIKIHTLFVVAHPAHLQEALRYKQELLKVHPQVKLQRFLGFYQDRLYPQAIEQLEFGQKDGIANYPLYQKAFGQKQGSTMLCHSDKVLIAPDGNIYNCHYKAYTAHQEKLGNLFDDRVNVRIPRQYFTCHDFGFCNPCDSEGHLFKTLNAETESISEVKDA